MILVCLSRKSRDFFNSCKSWPVFQAKKVVNCKNLDAFGCRFVGDCRDHLEIGLANPTLFIIRDLLIEAHPSPLLPTRGSMQTRTFSD